MKSPLTLRKNEALSKNKQYIDIMAIVKNFRILISLCALFSADIAEAIPHTQSQPMADGPIIKFKKNQDSARADITRGIDKKNLTFKKISEDILHIKSIFLAIKADKSPDGAILRQIHSDYGLKYTNCNTYVLKNLITALKILEKTIEEKAQKMTILVNLKEIDNRLKNITSSPVADDYSKKLRIISNSLKHLQAFTKEMETYSDAPAKKAPSL